MEFPLYRYEFERKRRRVEEKRRSDGWVNDEIGFRSRGNLINGLGNQIRKEEVEKQEQDRDEMMKYQST
jgi:hypothetical protein